jgi:hypothetical protein
MNLPRNTAESAATWNRNARRRFFFPLGPGAAVEGEAAARDDTVHVVVLGEGLSPGMQHHGDGGFGAEVAGIERESAQRPGDAAEEQPQQDAAVDAEERVERVRQGEHDVEVGHRQQHRLLGGHPLRALRALAFGTVAVAAGVVRDAPRGTGLALLDVSPQRRGAAGGKRTVQGPRYWCFACLRKVRKHDILEYLQV